MSPRKTDLIDLIVTESDDVDFVALVRRWIRNAILMYAPQDIFVIHVDNWFSEKWLGFSGKVFGGWGVPRWDVYVERRIPPFHPHRVQSEASYRWSSTARHYVKQGARAPLHVSQFSEENVRRPERRILAVSPSAVFAWYSGNTRQNTQGSIMVYRAASDTPVAWYLGFEKHQDSWRVQKTRGHLRKTEVSSFEAVAQTHTLSSLAKRLASQQTP